MNYLHMGLFLLYAGAVIVAGVAVDRKFLVQDKCKVHPFYWAGETFLLGSIFVIGLMMVLSLVGLYNAFWLWAAVAVQYLFLLQPAVRERLFSGMEFLKKGVTPDVWILAGVGLFFIFRNGFFLMDVDSHSSYLYAQKLWLENGTSLVGDLGTDMRVFTPHFNAIPYALGISLFPGELFFPQMVVASWTLCVIFLVYGYTTFRLQSGWYGLAASLLVLFDEHMFFSGANRYVIINSAIIAMFFAAVVRLRQALQEDDSAYGLALAVVFGSHLMANKYQFAYIVIGMTILGLVLRPRLAPRLFRMITREKVGVLVIVSVVFASLWYVKNVILTGCPTFPVLAEKFGVWNWSSERSVAFLKGCGDLGLGTFLKYFTYLFVWPGVRAAKVVVLLVIFLPLIYGLGRKRASENFIEELSFWLSVSIVGLAGIALANYTDPRVYRYLIAVFAFTAVLGLHRTLRDVLGLPKILCVVMVVMFAVSDWRNMFNGGVSFDRPSLTQNWQVYTDQLHTRDVVEDYYPKNKIIENAGFSPDTLSGSAWVTGANGFAAGGLSMYFAPTLPILDLWLTSVVHWESYENSQNVLADLQTFGIERVLDFDEDQIVFRPVADYAEQAVGFDRRPQKTFYDYSFPEELTTVRW